MNDSVTNKDRYLLYSLMIQLLNLEHVLAYTSLIFFNQSVLWQK